MNAPCQNTDREIWRERIGDYYANSIHVTSNNGIGIDCGGTVIVAPLHKWHRAGQLLFGFDSSLANWRRKLAMWLLKADKPIKHLPKE